MKRSLFLFFLLLSISAFGKIWIVDSNAGSTSKDFTTLQSAHDGASAGDTLYLIGSPNNYIATKVTITKKLVIMGPGFFLNENPDTQVNILTAFVNNTTPVICEELEFGAGSEGSALMGLDIVGRLVIKANNILIKRNHIHQESGCSKTMVDITASNIFFVQNFVDGSQGDPNLYLVLVNGVQSNIVIANNFMDHSCGFCGATVYGVSSASSALEISNNVFLGGLNVSTSLIQNNIFRNANNVFAPGSIVRNNFSIGNNLPAGNGNVNNVPLTGLFAASGSSDGYWQLKPGSPGLGAGFGGTDVGMFGGIEPYVLSGIPPIPAIYSITAPLVGDKVNGLPVQIKVKSRN